MVLLVKARKALCRSGFRDQQRDQQSHNRLDLTNIGKRRITMTQKRTLKEIALELLHKYAVARLTANDGCFNPSQADKDLKA